MNSHFVRTTCTICATSARYSPLRGEVLQRSSPGRIRTALGDEPCLGAEEPGQDVVFDVSVGLRVQEELLAAGRSLGVFFPE